jgi:hypothetical protein
MPERTSHKAAALGLILVMVVGSLVLWIGIPVGWLWLASQITGSTQASLGPYLLVIAGIPISMVIAGKFLTRVNAAYGRVTGAAPTVHLQLPWMKSMRGERDSGRPLTVLEIVMMVTVGTAAVAFAIWFFFFAGSSLPT